MTPNIVSLECRDIPIEKVVVFSDRAELKRLAKVTLEAGENEIHIKVSHPARASLLKKNKVEMRMF